MAPPLVAFVAAGLFLTLSSAIAPAQQSAVSILSASPCRAEIERRLSQWHARDEVLRAPAGPGGAESYRIATDEIGVWLTLRPAIHRGPIRVFRTDHSRTEVVEFSVREEADAQACVVSELRTLASSSSSSGIGGTADTDPGAPPAFTDRDLIRALAENDRLVIYLWSPHMPLSVEGLAEIDHAARDAGFHLVSVLHPDADAEYAQREANEHDLPATSLRRAASVELLFRDLLVHAPSILVCSSGAFSAVLPGFRNRRAYRQFLVESGTDR
jgi:hypothetical protein